MASEAGGGMSIRDIRLAVVRVIEATTPDAPYQEIAFKHASPGMGLSLSELAFEPSESPEEDTRLFKVIAEVGTRFGEWDGNLSHLIKTMRVEILYRVPRRDDGFDEVMEMANADEDRLAHELNKPDWPISPWDGTTLENIESIDDSEIVPLSDEYPREWLLLTMRFEVSYNLGDN